MDDHDVITGWIHIRESLSISIFIYYFFSLPIASLCEGIVELRIGIQR